MLHLKDRLEVLYWQNVKRARTYLPGFIELCARDEGGDPLVLDFIHLSWIFHVDYAWNHGKHALIMAPFGSGKSSCFAVPLAAWLLGCNPQERIKFVCNGDDFAKQRVAAAKDIIESPIYRDVFPHIRPGGKWSDHELFVKRKGGAHDPSIHARGIMTKGIGGRADRIIFDDICDQLNTEEPASRTKVKKFSTGTWMSRLDGTGARALMIATPWHPDDATHAFWSSNDWCALHQPVGPDKLVYEQSVTGAGPEYADAQRAFFRACGFQI